MKVKAKELRLKNKEDLTTELESLLKAHFALRMQRGMRQPVKLSEFKHMRRNIARVKTILHERLNNRG